MKPAEELTAAAEKIRGVAGSANPGPWRVSFLDGHTAQAPWVYAGEHRVAMFELCGDVAAHGDRRQPDAEHVALWHPSIAELVAQLLEGEAHRWALREVADYDIYWMGPLCKLARAILGGVR